MAQEQDKTPTPSTTPSTTSSTPSSGMASEAGHMGRDRQPATPEGAAREDNARQGARDIPSPEEVQERTDEANQNQQPPTGEHADPLHPGPNQDRHETRKTNRGG